MRLKTRKTKSGTYYIPSISIKESRKTSTKHPRRMKLNKNEETLTPTEE